MIPTPGSPDAVSNPASGAPSGVAADARLVRVIGVGPLAASIVNLTIASGIFVVPAFVAAGLGAAAPIAYLICAAAIALVALCFAEAGSRVSATGGVYAYSQVAFGDLVGFVVGVLFWIGSLGIGNAAVAALFVLTVGQLVPALATPLARFAVLATTYLVLAVLNVRGVKLGMRIGTGLAMLKLAPLLLLVIVGVPLIAHANLIWPHVTLSAIGPTCLVLIFAFMGVEGALTPGGEFADSARTVPRGILLGLGAVVVLYLSIQTVAQGVMGPALAANTSAPIAALANIVLGSGGRVFVLAATAIATLGYLSADMLASPRASYAMARDGLLPDLLAHVHPRFRTPHVAIWAYAAIAFAFGATGSFEQLVILASVSTLLIYLACCLSTLVLRRERVAQAGRPFVLPGGPTIPILGSGVVIWLIASASRREVISVGGLILLSLLTYVATRYKRRRVAVGAA